MPDSEEKLDEGAAIRRLNAALALQYRAALQYSVAAASMRGLEAQAVAARLTDFADQELSDCRRLIEKVVSFGGEPNIEIAELRYEADASESIGWLVECEREAVEALQEAIEPTGREGRSEALEHLLEHIILRKQEQVDFLERAAG